MHQIFWWNFRIHTKIFQEEKKAFLQSVKPIRPGLLSLLLGQRGGSEAQMPKIKVTINQIRLNFPRIIEAIKACLMQNLSLVACPVLEIWHHKIPSWEENESSNSDIYTQKWVNLKKKWVLCPESFFSTQNWPPPLPQWQFQQFSSRGKLLFIFKISETSRWKKWSSNPSDWPISVEFDRSMF